jgi:hypothetical protein
VYKFKRLGALLTSLSITPLTSHQPFLRWLRVILGYAAYIVAALAVIFRTPHDWPITWHDVVALDEIARSFLLSCYLAFVSGYSTLYVVLSGVRLSSKRMLPLPDLAPALLKATRERDPRIVRVAREEQAGSKDSATDEVNTLAATTLKVASPEPLTGSLWMVIGIFAVSLVPLSFFVVFLWFVVATGLSQMTSGTGSGAAGIYLMIRITGMFAPLVALALLAARGAWTAWRARVRGAVVEINAEGMSVRDQHTHWRQRFIRWSDVVSVLRFTYIDANVHPCTVYLLDAGVQTFLWEAPADMRYVSQKRLARIVQRQTQASRLLTLIEQATALPPLDITSVIAAVTKIDPNPYSTSEEPDVKDIELLAFIEGADSPEALTPLAPPPTTAERWRRGLLSALIFLALAAATIGFAGGFNP